MRTLRVSVETTKKEMHQYIEKKSTYIDISRYPGNS